jgi:glycosyltransferase involved in cell wall biosynthesis
MSRLKFLFIEPFFGGSHRSFAEGLVAHSRHSFDLVTLPARFWKWRLRGAALHFFKKIKNIAHYDGIITSDMMSLSDFKALTGPVCPPVLVYFHENQLTYPLAPGESRDFQYGFTDLTTALAADRILFNSHTHHDAFFTHLPKFIKMMPEYRPNWAVAEIKAKSGVLYPGCSFEKENDPSGKIDLQDKTGAAPLIIWNHRWEFDKKPDDFFAAIDSLVSRKIDFRLALLGENFQVVPKAFIAARKRLGARIVCYGYEESHARYIDWLKQGAVVVSTAIQENFGIAAVEAMRYGCVPLLPQRLAYPEVLPRQFHAHSLYSDQADLEQKLGRLIKNYPQSAAPYHKLPEAMKVFAWEEMISHYDDELANLVEPEG